MSRTTVTSLTPDAWLGLPLLAFEHLECERFIDLELPEPVLVFWLAGGTAVDVHRPPRQHWHYRGRAHHFDLYASGGYSAIFCDAAPSRKVVANLGAEITSALLGDDASGLALEACRFQFVDSMLERLLRRLVAHADDGEPLGPLYTQALSMAVLYQLAPRAGRMRRREGSAALGVAIRDNLAELIESRLATPPSIPDMALLAGLCSATFVKAFKTSFGASPHQYVLDRRIERAKRLLGQQRSLTEIALELGFASHAHFSATFRARTGETPSEYRDGARCVA